MVPRRPARLRLGLPRRDLALAILWLPYKPSCTASAAIQARSTEFWGGQSREALAAFGNFAKVDVGDLAPTPQIYGVIKGKTAVVCPVEAEGEPPHHAPTPPSDYGGGGYDHGGGGYGGGGGY